MSEPQTSEPRVTITDSQVGVVGDHAHVEGGIHFHTAPPANSRERRNRAAMLQLVRNTWIKGLLEQSLHGAALIELGLEYCPDAVDHPWDTVVQMPERPDRQLPPGTCIVEVFDESGGSLLILGEPGSGKTTMLLELARDLIARAGQDETLHIPVVFNLSSWAVKQASLEEWLLEELRTRYYIPKKVAQGWLENDALLLLLDGLDEVKADTREKCLAAINTFREQHLVPFVVCSRTADYEKLVTKLNVHMAIFLRPLTSAQIDAYLAGAGTELRAVRATMQHDPVLREMAKSPLFLSVMTLTYRDTTMDDLQFLSTSEARRQRLFDSFIRYMFQHRIQDRRYACQQVLHWLAWLAAKLTEHEHTVFLIEEIQPFWLPPSEHRRIRLLNGVFLGVLSGLYSGLFVGLYVGLLIGYIEQSIQVVFEMIMSLSGIGMLVGGITGLASGWLKSLGRLESIKPVETLTWSWHKAFRGLISGLLAVPILALGLRALLIAIFDLNADIHDWLLLASYLGLLTGLDLALNDGLSNRAAAFKTVPNQGIRQSLKNALIGGIGVGLFGGMILGSVGGIALLLIFEGRDDLNAVLFFGLFLGVILGVVSGQDMVLGKNRAGRMVILHYCLRYVLARKNCLPFRIVPFLDYCVDRIFLRRVGGGYIFIHRLLMEHFASLTPEDIERIAANVEGARA